MKQQTLTDVFNEPDFKLSIKGLFRLKDIENTTDITNAESVENARDLVNSLVATATTQLLDISLTDIMLSAWTKMSVLQEFAAGEKLNSTKTHKFQLAKHKITSNHSPKIELLVYDKKIAEVTVDITLTLVIAKANLMIKRGRILAIRIDGCQAMGKISCRGQKIFEKKSTELDFRSSIKLGDGIEIPPPLRIKKSGSPIKGQA